MSDTLPNYSQIYELTKRRLRGLKKLSEKRQNFGMEDMVLLTLLGNMNQRLHTMFSLLELGITDGVFPLQRTFFEMLVAYKAMLQSENKERYVQFYRNKNSFETSNKVHRMLSKSDPVKGSFEEWEIKFGEKYKNISQDELELILNGKKGSKFKQWFELAAGKTFSELVQDIDVDPMVFYICYDEPSNWVHPQRIEKNINPNDFEPVMALSFYGIMLSSLLRSCVFLYDSMADFAEYIEILESKQLTSYGKSFSEYLDNLKIFIANEHKRIYNEEQEKEIANDIKKIMKIN
ncbi:MULTISPECIES: DUF5677 domain-containing protein [Lactococcus]|uniref:DUF5677 domain-containing protein n=1 Tax=Lactococcus TaxID=1357 RepID=UPI001A8EA3C5|nr:MULTISPECIES: DUF5677 domain-containing protein [Lactococcus]QSR03169.1 hypothetical protein J0J36_10225 [Lactococcus sp. LG1074]QUW40317.1 hypothetical protein [Lactococcus garvieae]